MTGYGRGVADLSGRRVVVEIRSVNHRFLDIKTRGHLRPAVEERISKLLRQEIDRGSLTVSVRTSRDSLAAAFRIDHAAARIVATEFATLARELHLSHGPSLSLITSQPGVISDETSEEDEALHANLIEKALVAAMSDLNQMRSEEGNALQADFEMRVKNLEDLAKFIATSAEKTPQDAQKRLSERLAKLLRNTNVEVDPDRLAHEVAIVADRLDITEELVRLNSHFSQTTELVRGKTKDGEVVGKKLGFLIQEIGREFNTITSKSQNAEICRAVVDAKAEIEKIREQIQNVE